MDRLAAPVATADSAFSGSTDGQLPQPLPAPTAVPVQSQTSAPVVTAPVMQEPKLVRPTNARAAPAAERQTPTFKPPTSTEPSGAEPQLAAAAPPSAAEPELAPAPVASVDQRCAGSANFIARDVCRMRACGIPALAGDPVCVRFREMEEANRNRTNQ